MKIQYNAAVLILFVFSSFLFLLFRLSHAEGLIPRLLLYKSLVHPHLENCSGVWDPYNISDVQDATSQWGPQEKQQFD